MARLPKKLRRLGRLEFCTGCAHTSLSHENKVGRCRVTGCRCVVLHGVYPE